MLKKLIEDRKAKIGIIGLGYVGLPLAVEFGHANFSVTGFDVDINKIKSLNQGKSYIQDVSSSDLKHLVSAGRIKATTDFTQLSKMNAVIVCVPTPLRKTKDPDISYIMSATQKLAENLQKGQLIVLESTTYPGTTRELLLPEFERLGFFAGKDFYLAFSPERVDPGNPKFGIKNTPKIVGGMTKSCTDLAAALYGTVVNQVLPVSSPEVAEMVKLLENTFRAVNIALVNEVALMCDKLNLDVWEVIDAAATKPFGFMPFYPGPGIGGHCIPLDPHYLSWKLKSLNFYSRFIELAGETNSSMPEYLIGKIIRALNQKKTAVKGADILVLGVSYKKDVGDVRESPALDVIELLRHMGATIRYHDPYVNKLSIDGWSSTSLKLTPAALKNQDCVVIVTNHQRFDMKWIVEHSPLIIDARNATKGISSKKIVKL